MNGLRCLSVVLLLFLLSCDRSRDVVNDPADLLERAQASYQEQNYRQAKSLLEQAIPMFDKEGKTTALVQAHTYAARTDLQLAEFQSALAHVDAGIALSKASGDFRAETQFSLLRGDAAAAMLDEDFAIESYQRALSLTTTFNDERAAAEAELKLANALLRKQELNEANEHYQSVLTRAQSLGDQSTAAEALLGIGDVYRQQERYVESLNSLTQALGSFGRGKNPVLTAKLLSEVGRVHLDQRNLSGALTDFRDAINALRRARTGREFEPSLLFRIGRIYDRLAKPSEAKKYYTDGMDAAKSLGDKIAENYLALVLVKANLALMTPEQRSRVGDRERQSYEQLAKRFQDCGHRTGEALCYHLVGKYYDAIGSLQQARDWYQKAVALDGMTLGDYYDPDVHSAFLDELQVSAERHEWYESLADVNIRMHRNQDALLAAELAQQRRYSDVFHAADFNIRQGELKSTMDQVRAEIRHTRILELELSAKQAHRSREMEDGAVQRIMADLEESKQNLQSLSVKVAGTFPNYQPLLFGVRPDLTGIQKYIPRGSLVVEFVPGDSTIAILTLSRTQLAVTLVPARKDSVFVLVREYKQLLQDPTVYSGEANAASVPAMTRFAFLSTRLYDILLRPIEPLMERGLVIVVSSGFEGFPFHAIERQERNTVHYVMELASVDYITSLGALKYKTTATSHIRDVVAFGNPTGKNWSVDYELRDIRSFFKSAHIVTGLEASWDNLRSTKADVLQISTEFVRGKGTSPLGEMKLSNGLTVEESTDIPFEKLTELAATPIILLSNNYGQGTGLGPTQALVLRMSGTSDVFLNAWFADRKAGKFFSELFYTQLANGLAPGDAYRQALLGLIKNREVSHPRSWAQYFHFGVG